MRTSKYRLLRLVATVYVEVLRNIPLLLVVYICFYTIPQFGLNLDSFTSGLIALVLNSTAYTVEIFRGGLRAIPKGQYEAAYSLGMRPRQVFTFVTFPQLMRVSFPALGNQVAGVILGTSLVTVVGVAELTNVALTVGGATFRYFEAFVVAAVFYFVAVQTAHLVWVAIGRRWATI